MKNLKLKHIILIAIGVLILLTVLSKDFRKLLHDLLFNPLGFDWFGRDTVGGGSGHSDDASGGDPDSEVGDSPEAGIGTGLTGDCDPSVIVSEWTDETGHYGQNECGGIVVFC